jgi:hypothetical protein
MHEAESAGWHLSPCRYVEVRKELLKTPAGWKALLDGVPDQVIAVAAITDILQVCAHMGMAMNIGSARTMPGRRVKGVGILPHPMATAVNDISVCCALAQRPYKELPKSDQVEGGDTNTVEELLQNESPKAGDTAPLGTALSSAEQVCRSSHRPRNPYDF